MHERLEASEQRFRGLFEGAGVGIAVTTLDGRFVDANPAYIEMLGYPLEELRQRDYQSITHPEDLPRNLQMIRDLIDGRHGPFAFEKRYRAKQGQTVWVRCSVALIRDVDGAPLHITATTEDITAAKRAERHLHRSESLRRLAGQLARVGGWSVAAEDRQIEWTDEVFRIMEVPGDEPPSLDEVLQRYSTEDRQRLTAALETCFADGTPFDLEVELVTFAGHRLPVHVIGEPQFAEDGEVTRVLGAFQDISDLRAATIEAEQAAQRLISTFESMTDAIFTLDQQWRFTYLNRRAEQLLQRDRAGLIGRNVWEEFPEAVDGDLYFAYHRAVERGEAQTVEEHYYPPLETWFSVNAYPSEQGLAVYFRDVTKAHRDRVVLQRQAELLDAAQDAIIVRDLDHTVTYWNRSAERVYGWTAQEAIGRDVRELIYDDPRALDPILTVLLSEGDWAGENAHRNRAGERLTVASRLTLVRDHEGQPEAVLAINTDVTDARRIEQQLLRTQRMESLGTLAGGVAHDLNNVLSPVLLAAELLTSHDLDATAAELVSTIEQSARRGADLVSQVLSFARGVEGQRAPVGLRSLLLDIQTIVRDTFPKDITLKVRASEGLGSVVGDATQLQQVLLNLAVNARDAMPDGGHLNITASSVTLDEQYAAATPGIEPGDFVRIDVEDDGTGMPPEVRERVFEPFFTTKPQGAGTGLGLSTVAAIVRSHGGFVNVYSEAHTGTRFRVYLPRDAATIQPDPPDPATSDLPRGNGRSVLVVDDEPAVRSITRRTLEAFGYEVLEADDGAEAVSVYAQHGDRIAVVLTDMMMPVMDGPATVRALRRLDPHVRIIGASGLHANGKVTQAGHAGVRHFLPKPYSSRDLLELLDRVLDEDG